jgi:hypothetical protein
MNDDRAREGLIHLQAAALELIAAGRAFLDVTEELVREPAALSALIQLARTMAAQAAEPPRAGERQRPGTDHEGNGVTRIRVT